MKIETKIKEFLKDGKRVNSIKTRLSSSFLSNECYSSSATESPENSE